MTDYLRIFEAKALAEELTKTGHSISERTAQRWKAGDTKPKPQDIRAIRKLVGDTVPDATKTPPPDWAGAVISAVEDMPTRIAALVTLRDEERMRIARESAQEGQELTLRVLARLLERVAGTPLEGEMRAAMLDVLGNDGRGQ